MGIETDGTAAATEFEKLGYYSTADFVALGRIYGLDEKSVHGILDEYRMNLPQVEMMVARALLPEDAKREHLHIFTDRLAMFRWHFALVFGK